MTPHEFMMTEGKQESGMLHSNLEQCTDYNPSGEKKGEDKLPKPAPQFDSAAHRAFMRSLG